MAGASGQGMGGNLGFGGASPAMAQASSYNPAAYQASSINGADRINANTVNMQQARQSQGALDPTQALQRSMSGQIDNPYLGSLQQASNNTAMRGYNDAMDSMTENLLPQVRSGAVGAGQYGSSRQGIAEGMVAKQAARNARDLGIASMDAGSKMYGDAYNQAQERAATTATGLNNQAFQANDNNASRDLTAQTNNAGNQLTAQSFNAGAQNTAGQFNANAQNSAGQFNAGAQNTASLANAGNTNQFNIAGMNNATTQRGQDQSFALGQGNLALGNRTADQNFTLGQGNLGVSQQNANTNTTSANNQYLLGQGNLTLGNRTADQNYTLGQGNLALGNRQAANSYDLGLRNNDLGFGQLDANINQQNFNNQLSGANFGLSMYDRVNANNAAGVNAATTIQNTPYNYYTGFSNLANNYGNAGASGSSSTAMPGNPLIGGLAGYQMASNPNFRSSLGF